MHAAEMTIDHRCTAHINLSESTTIKVETISHIYIQNYIEYPVAMELPLFFTDAIVFLCVFIVSRISRVDDGTPSCSPG